jgi:hypothetical protein
VTYDGRNGFISKCTHQSNDVAHTAEQGVGQQIVPVLNGLRGTPTVTTQIGSNDVKTSRCQRKQLIPPRIGQLRKSVKKHDAWGFAAVARFEDVKSHTGVGVDSA